jgi:UDP-glucose 4-epimerase
VRRILHLSTIHVYGPLRGEIDEASPVDAKHPYAAAHAAAERILATVAAERVNHVALRLSNTVGPPIWPGVDRWTLVTNDLARGWAMRGRFALRSSGTQLIDFIPLTDVARAVAHLVAGDAPLPAVLNVCTGETRRVVDVACRMSQLAEQRTGQPAPVDRPATDGDDHPLFHLSNARLRATGFELVGDLDAELDGILRFSMEHFSAVTR